VSLKVRKITTKIVGKKGDIIKPYISQGFSLLVFSSTRENNLVYLLFYGH
jgi:hypothetical protein